MANLNEILDDLGVSQEEYEAVMDEIDVTAGFNDYDSAIMHIEQVVKNLEDKKLKGELVTDLTEWLDCRDAVEESLIITSGGMESELESEDRMLLSRLASLIKEQGYDNMDYEFGNVLDFMDARAAELESYNKVSKKESYDHALKDPFDKIKRQFDVREILENAFNVFEKTGVSSSESLLDDRLNANRYALKEVSRILASTARDAEFEDVSNDDVDKLRDYAVKRAMKLDSYLPEDELAKCFLDDLDVSETFGFSETVMTGDPLLGVETQDEFNRILAYRMVRKGVPENKASFVANYIMDPRSPKLLSSNEYNEDRQSNALMEFLEENDINFAINKNITDAVSRCWLLDSYSKRLYVACRYPEFTQMEMVEASTDAAALHSIAISEYDDTCQMIDDRIKALKEIYMEQGFDNIMPFRSGEEILSDSAKETADVSFSKEALKLEKDPDKSYQIIFDDVIKETISRDIPEPKEATKDDADFGFDV